MGCSDYERIEAAIEFLSGRVQHQPSLDELAQHIGLSSFHLQRLFKRWAGVSPKRFLQHLTIDNARRRLRASQSVLDTSFAVGLSGPSRLHDLFLSVDAVTPGEFKSGGAGLTLTYGFHETPFGEALLVESVRGICALAFAGPASRETVLEEVRQRWRAAEFVADGGVGRETIETLFGPEGGGQKVSLLLKGTNFQLKVWEALLRIPEGAVTSYGRLAEMVGRPGASRAVGTAVGQNPIAFLIPCHRVLRANGAVGGYHWGTIRKQAMLVREAVRSVD
ncbi:MAG: methylated-DNA--[protein]-cysteine S-methyltransferase [Planctomycetota bacterium]|jgi:AraC family transcriptional regulator of adaptative response/methylated-DNA-[protein]-cysteine methyltransferase